MEEDNECFHNNPISLTNTLTWSYFLVHMDLLWTPSGWVVTVYTASVDIFYIK